MAEYISRETLLKAVEKLDRLDKETNTKYEYDKKGYILLIQNAPNADVVEVKHGGEWLKLKGDTPKTYKRVCSECGEIVYYVGKGCSYKCCPYCFVKMDGGKAE